MLVDADADETPKMERKRVREDLLMEEADEEEVDPKADVRAVAMSSERAVDERRMDFFMRGEDIGFDSMFDVVAMRNGIEP